MMTNMLENKNFWLMGALLMAAVTALGISANWQITLVVLGAALGLLLILINDEAGLILALASISAGQLIRVELTAYGGALLISDIVVAAVVGVYLIKKLIAGEKISAGGLGWPMILFGLWAVISLAYSLNFLPALAVVQSSFYLVRWVGYAMLLPLTFELAKKGKGQKIWSAVMIAGVMVAIIGFLQLIFVPNFAFMQRFGWDPHVGRLLSVFFDPNYVGGFLALLFSVILGFLLVGSRKKNAWWWVAGLVILIALLLTFSRSAFLGFFVGILIISLIKSWKMAIAAIVLMALILISSPRLQQRFLAASSVNDSAQARIESWQDGWQIVRQHPLVGVGFDTLAQFRNANPGSGKKVALSAAGIDSSLLTIWATTGVVGLGLYLIIYITLIWRSLAAYYNQKLTSFSRGLGLGLGAGLIGLFVSSQFINSLLYPPIMIVVWVLAGIMLAQSLPADKIESSEAK